MIIDCKGVRPMRFTHTRSLPTQYSLPATRAGLLASVVLLAACTVTPTIDERDSFTQGNTYSRSFSGSSQAACEAGRRSLLGQGYIIDKAEPNRVSGHKNYQDQQNDNQHAQIIFNVDCTPRGNGDAIVYVSALRELYTMKKSSNSASVGLSVLGAVSMPVGASDDSLVKTSSETISRGAFYDGFFEQLKQNLSSAKAAINSGTTPAQNPQAQKPQTATPPEKPAAPAPTAGSPAGSGQPAQPRPTSQPAQPSPPSSLPAPAGDNATQAPPAAPTTPP
ncbi:DUF2242 domain-containing protein [Bordetella sp. BOR01]|uniref:DUF2242 domain-containing protein n=1 Tax=Bordetella sp. BOR01 TaxID=2854779 RepID=UPI001C47A45F|nr:DUF2242 domain-containing protein [Bordetella sp. BOR01]MBV7483345.1 DUF2242 domain-containing protein [Bordetella sp. BOR01]